MISRRTALKTAVIGTVSLTTFTLVTAAGLTPVAFAATTTFTPVADTYVDSSSPATNFGTAGQLGVDNSPIKRIFLRFDVSGLVDPVTSAKLRIHVDDVKSARSNNGGTFSSMTNITWSETAVTWNNQPAIDGATLGSLGSVSRNTWYEIDVTSFVTGNGTFSIGATSPSNDDAGYDSRETGATAPQLVIDTGQPPPPGDPVLVGAGDIAGSGSGDEATASLLDNIAGTVFTAGDNVYDNGTLTEFNTWYEPTWGRHKARTKPSPGNHDYNTAGASGYYTYFGAVANGPNGYYSYDLGNWHVVAINSNVARGVGSAQEQWLRADLAASTKPCTVAYWHHPRFTSGANHSPDTSMGPIVQALYDFNADVVVAGHNHNYERFAPMNPSGQLDTVRGIRHFVAGMGGRSHYSFGTIQPNSEVRNSTTYGVLKLTLHANSYDWQFVPQAGMTFTDNGTTSCH
jgi:acid phosphatase type 7